MLWRLKKIRFGLVGGVFVLNLFEPAFANAVTIQQHDAANLYLAGMLMKQETPGIQCLFLDANQALFQFCGKLGPERNCRLF